MDASSLRIVEIGDKPFFKRAYPDQTAFFSTSFAGNDADVVAGGRRFSLRTAAALHGLLGDPATSLIICHPTFFSPWHWRWLSRVFFDRRLTQGRFPLVRAFGPQMLRMRARAPIAIVDQEDIPVINQNNFFLLDRSTLYFKRELPVDRWRVFLKTGHPNLPTPRFRRLPHYDKAIAKLRPLSMGLPLWHWHLLPAHFAEKTTDVFFAGRVLDSSFVRQRGLSEILALRDRNIIVDIPDRALSPQEFYARCARAWLTWSPEGFGWECFRHYEAPACGSVPVINLPGIERHRPLCDGSHAFFYCVEPGGLTRTIVAALADKERLRAMAGAARDHVLAHHTPTALAAHVVEETLAAAGGQARAERA
ncbi:MAG: glycosyltransferase family 1 protein [Proteobacteria bacterium]|nr:glycosyltransferase family 1 protein [Pseudomonadota bacterium]